MSEDIRYVTDPRGKRIAVVDGTPNANPKKRKRKPFEAQWVRFPLRWVEALRKSKKPSAYQLALVILGEAFKQEQLGGEIILSSTVTRMQRQTRREATKELIKLGLIKTEQNGREALRVSHIYYY
jgi:hypothetical protein